MNIRPAHYLLLVGVVVLISGCISGVREPDSYVSSTGEKTLIESDRESCTRSCNSDYSRCMDTGSAQDSGFGSSSGVIGPKDMFGASADCRRDLKSCLSGCGAR